MMAGLAVLEELEKGTAYPYINGLTETLCREMDRLGERLGVPLWLPGWHPSSNSTSPPQASKTNVM